jgi:hypothetical protein
MEERRKLRSILQALAFPDWLVLYLVARNIDRLVLYLVARNIDKLVLYPDCQEY